MLTDNLLVTQLRRDAASQEWSTTTETLLKEPDTSCLDINCTDARCVLEAVIYSEPNIGATQHG